MMRNIIREKRKERGLSQEELAKKLGWTRSMYTKRENGAVSLGVDELAKIATALEMPESRISIFFNR